MNLILITLQSLLRFELVVVCCRCKDNLKSRLQYKCIIKIMLCPFHTWLFILLCLFVSCRRFYFVKRILLTQTLLYFKRWNQQEVTMIYDYLFSINVNTIKMKKRTQKHTNYSYHRHSCWYFLINFHPLYFFILYVYVTFDLFLIFFCIFSLTRIFLLFT